MLSILIPLLSAGAIALSPGATEAVFFSTAGQVLLGLCGCLLLIGHCWVRSLCRVDQRWLVSTCDVAIAGWLPVVYPSSDPLGVLAVGFLSWASFGLLALALVCLDLGLERLTVMSQKRRQQKAFRAYWPWLVDLMRIAISGGAAHGVAFDHALTALKHSPLNAFGQRVFARRDEGQDRIGAICSVAREMESREALDLGLAMRESAKQGSDLSPLLIEQARALRERTQRRLEQAANGLSVKLLIPLVICFFPMFFIVLAFTIFHSLGRLPWSS